MNYYNDHDPFCCAWLRELMKDALIPEGVVDERPIQEVRRADLVGFTHCHFFAGIAGWAEALRLARWPHERTVWTASLPCQPFSSAGKQKGEEDERHLWPVFAALVRQCHPDCIFGEQVDSAIGREWLDGVRADLEAEGYTFGAASLCAAGAGAPHIRQRLFWVAQPNRSRSRRSRVPQPDLQQHSVHVDERGDGSGQADGRQCTSRLADACDSQRRQGRTADGRGARRRVSAPGSDVSDRGVANAGPSLSRQSSGRGCPSGSPEGQQEQRQRQEAVEPRRCGATGRLGDAGSNGRQQGTARPSREEPDVCGHGHDNAWSDFILLSCRDGKVRRASPQPALFPLDSGLPNRVGTLRGAGNSIVPQVAATFVRAFLDVEGGI